MSPCAPNGHNPSGLLLEVPGSGLAAPVRFALCPMGAFFLCGESFPSLKDEVKSSWPLYVGLLMCYNRRTNGFLRSNPAAIPKPFFSTDWRLQPALHEAGIVSNRGSARHGESFGALYTPPVTSGEYQRLYDLGLSSGLVGRLVSSVSEVNPKETSEFDGCAPTETRRQMRVQP